MNGWIENLHRPLVLIGFIFWGLAILSKDNQKAFWGMFVLGIVVIFLSFGLIYIVPEKHFEETLAIKPPTLKNISTSTKPSRKSPLPERKKKASVKADKKPERDAATASGEKGVAFINNGGTVNIDNR